MTGGRDLKNHKKRANDLPKNSSLGGPSAARAVGDLIRTALARRKADAGSEIRSKLGVLKALGRGPQASTEHLNRYISGAVLPTPRVLRKLAKALGISERRALLVAGYLQEVVREISTLIALAKAQCAEHRPALSFKECVSPVTRERRYMRQSDQFMYAQVGEREDAPRFFVPWTAVSAAYLAVAGFPKRGEERRVESFLVDVAGAEQYSAHGRRGRNARELSLAKSVLVIDTMGPDDRRACAAELVRSWIKRECGEFALALERVTYHQRVDVGVPSLFGTEGSKI